MPSRQELFAQRFHREANAIAALQSPHTVYLYDFGTTQDGRLYYVMELLDGISLQTLSRRSGRSRPRASSRFSGRSAARSRKRTRRRSCTAISSRRT